ncbi:MAG: HAMP domain-containing protein [Drouetiella hepatica Uher 2000/2452]|jgi:heavy metal sensor kinase|uniref:histidine kinase n=1 Tax=Drouetiella hepatica Uher 2000/2452 TaxID=904376 RepID=A0A951UP43_9CYAN|nr:HAMP domain-containing protein [Drouetiella hepatica Uher 2000/2452]
MIRSFRLRIALFSVALAGSALVGFGIIAWRLIYVAEVSRLDAKLESQAKRATRPRSPEEWQAFGASLSLELGADADTPTAVLVKNSQGEVLYQSGQEFAEINLQNFFPPLLIPPVSPDENDLALGTEKSPRNLDRSFSVMGGMFPNPRIQTQRTATGDWRIGAVSTPRAQAAIAISLQAIDQEMDVIRNIFLVAISGTLLLVAGGAWGLSGRALRPIRRLTAAIQQVTVAGLDQQIHLGATDVEFVELIQVFNQMLERLERSFKQASRFSADAAHELKTPLAILQGELEQALYHAEPGSEVQQNLSNLLDEVRRLSGIVRKLLLLSLADAGQMSLHKVEVNLSELLAVIVEDMELLAPHLTLEADVASDLWVWGDRDLLTQVLQNLVSNAIKYNLPNGWIRIQARQRLSVQVTISNASNTMPLSDRPRIFDRFYRGDPARTRKVEGIGLGLSLSREIARAHNGDLVLDSAPEGQTALTLSLPSR